jgi:hypothetical protein
MDHWASMENISYFILALLKNAFHKSTPWKYIPDMDPLKGVSPAPAPFKGFISGICFRALFVKNVKKSQNKIITLSYTSMLGLSAEMGPTYDLHSPSQHTFCVYFLRPYH